MKISEITIGPANKWRELSDENPLKATVKLRSKETTVGTVLDDADMNELLALVEHIIARAAKRNVEQFVAAVSGNHAMTIEGNTE